MPGIGTLSRDSIVRHLSEVLRPLPHVHAFWEAGAAAFNRIDEWSDIDLYIVVDEAEAVSETFLVVEKALTDLSPIRLKHESPGLRPPGFTRSSIAFRERANSCSSTWR